MAPGEVIAIVALFGTIGWVVSQIARAVLAHQARQLEMEKIRLGAVAPGGEALERLAEDVAAMRDQLVDVQERLDFTERLLAQVRGRDLLERGP